MVDDETKALEALAKEAQDADALFAARLQAEFQDQDDVHDVPPNANPAPSDSQFARDLQAEEDALHPQLQQDADAALAATLQEQFEHNSSKDCALGEQRDMALALQTQADECINTDAFECSVCLEQFEQVGDGILPPCSHVMCNDCFTLFIQTCIDQKQLAECPDQACAQPVPGWLVARLLGVSCFS